MNFIYYVKTALLFLPAYISNMSPLLVTRLTGGGAPLDMGMTFIDGRRLLGDNKTIKGTLSIIVVGSIVGLVYDPKFIGFIQASGVAIGDIVGSFMKRRLRIKPGGSLPLIDQELFILLAVLLSNPFLQLSLRQIAFILLITPILHLVSNAVAFLIGLKEVPY